MIRTIRAKTGAAALAWPGGGRRRRPGPPARHVHIDRQKWTFGGILGHFDDAQLQRGFKVYTEVCARCHSIKRLHFRNLAQPGGPGFPEAAIKSLAGNLPGRRRAGRAGQGRQAPGHPSPTPFPAPSRTSRRRASPRTAPCRPTSR